MIYIITLIILLILSLLFIFKIKVNVKYEIIEFNKIKLQVKFFLLNKTIFKFSSNNSLTEIITAYSNKDKQKEIKLKDSFEDSKKYVNHVIENISKEKVHINIFVSSSNAILTIYLSTFVSTIISTFLEKNISSKYINNVRYIITPRYTNNYILLNINIDTKLITILIIIIKILFQIARRKFNGKSSNRKLNVNSND